MPISPTAEGFRAAFRRPMLSVAEIAWRWATGATAAALLLFGLIEYLDTLPLTDGDLMLLRARQPYLVGAAIAHIFSGSSNHLLLATGIAAVLLAALWIFAASIGRFATVRALQEYFRVRFASADAITNREENLDRGSPANLRTLLHLNFLRAAVVLAAALATIGGLIAVGATNTAQSQLAILLFFPVAALIGLIAWVLNWFLSLAAMLAASSAKDARSAIVAAAELCYERAGQVLAVSIWTGLAHLFTFGVASVAVFIPLAFVRVMPWRLVVLASLLVVLAYFAVADWLYVARLAGYLGITEMPEETPIPPQPTPPPARALQTSIDRDELILSDVPSLATG